MPQVIIAGHLIRIQPEGNLLRLTRLKKSCLLIADQRTGRLAQFSLRCPVIKLNHFPSGVPSGIGNLHLHEDILPRGSFSHHRLQRKGRVGKTEAKRIDNLFSGSRQRFKIAVSNVDILRVIHVVRCLMKTGGRRIILQLFGKCIRQFSGRISNSHQKFRLRQAAFHAALPGHQRTGYSIIVLKPGSIHHAADVHDNNHPAKPAANGFDHPVLFIGQIEISALEQFIFYGNRFAVITKVRHGIAGAALSVPPLAGKTADGDDGGVREGRGRIQQIFRNFRLFDKSRAAAFLILVFCVLFIKLSRTVKNADNSILLKFHETIVNIVDVRRGNIAGTAAALYIVNCTFAEQCHP